MNFQGLNASIIGLVGLTLVACASTSEVSVPNKNSLSLAEATSPVVVAPEAVAKVTAVKTPAPSHNTYLICKAKKSRFHYDWDATQLSSGQADQNSIRFEFRQASRPAGAQGENLKVGECGWADQALAGAKKTSAQVTFKSLSDEATQSFYKLKTGKIFKFPVRQTKNGMAPAAGAGVSVVR
jgi:hypothetical protein